MDDTREFGWQATDGGGGGGGLYEERTGADDFGTGFGWAVVHINQYSTKRASKRGGWELYLLLVNRDSTYNHSTVIICVVSWFGSVSRRQSKAEKFCSGYKYIPHYNNFQCPSSPVKVIDENGYESSS